MENCFTVGEIKRLVRESSNEFKAVLGKGVEKEDKENNGKSYKETEKRVKDFQNDIEVPQKTAYTKSGDDNKGMLDFAPEDDVDASYKKRIHAQAMGYTSVAEKENKEEKTGEFNDNYYQAAKDNTRERNELEAEIKHSGLKSSKMPEGEFKKNDVYESKPMTLKFKKTQFLSEEHMKSRIPDECKVEGKRFVMKDKTDNQYLIEWKDNQANILSHENKTGFNESISRMQTLMGYNPANRFERSTVNEAEEGFLNTLNNTREVANGK